MKRRFLLIMLLMAMFAPLAMQAQGLTKAPRGTALQAASVQSKQIAKEMPQTREAGWLQYDNGTHVGDYGLSTAYLWEFGPLYPASMLGNNNTLSKVSFWENSSMIANYGVTVNVYQPDTTTLLYQEEFELNGSDGMHEVEFSDPVTIDPTKDLWITITVAGTYVFSVCQCTEANNDWVDWAGWRHGSEVGLTGLGWMIRGYVEYVDPASCPKPTQFAASDITINNTTLSWSGEARSYQVVYSNREGFNPDSATPIDVNETSYTLTNLTDGTTYYAYVRANCGDSFSPWSSMVSFTTISACAVPYNATASDITANSANITWNGWQDSYTLRYKPVVFYEDFEGLTSNALPEGWTTIDNDGDGNDWYGVDGYADYAHSGEGIVTSASYISSGALTPDNWLITPQLDLQGTMSVWLRAQDPSYAEEHYAIYLSTTGNTINDFTVTLVAEAFDLTGEYIEITADLSAYAGQQGYIAIRHFNCTDMFRMNVDDFLIETTNATWTTVDNVTSPYALTGLTENTQYFLQIQGNCPQGTTDWSSITSFTTLPLCQAPVLSLDEVTTTTATISWTGEARAYNIKLNGQLIEQDIRDNSYIFSNLDPGTYYTVEVQSNCGETGTSEWTSVSFYTKCEAFDLPYTYGFEDLSDLACWDMLSASDNVFGVVNIAEAGITEFEAYEGENAFVFSSYDQADSYAQLLMSPQLNTEAAVAFEFSYIVLGEDATEEVLVLYSTGTDDLDDFEVADAITAENTDAWMTYNTILPAGTKYVALYYYSDWQYYLFVDGFSFEEATEEVTQETALSEGWNWFSTYIHVEDPVAMLQAIEASLSENGVMIKSSDVYTENDPDWGWFGDLDEVGIVNEQMYKILVSAPCTVTVEGTPANPESHPITINQGWNWIGYPCSVSMSLDDAFAGFAQNGDKIRNSDGETPYDADWEMWFGDVETLEPGQGYMFYSEDSTPRTLVFPTGAKTRNIANFENLTKQPIKRVANINCKPKNGNQLKK